MKKLLTIPLLALFFGLSFAILNDTSANAHEYYEYEEYSSYEGYGNVPPGHLPPPEYRRGYHNVPPGHLPPPAYRNRRHHDHYRYERRYIKHRYPRYRRHHDSERFIFNAAFPELIEFIYEKHDY